MGSFTLQRASSSNMDFIWRFLQLGPTPELTRLRGIHEEVLVAKTSPNSSWFSHTRVPSYPKRRNFHLERKFF